jgi:hypothetical protein
VYAGTYERHVGSTNVTARTAFSSGARAQSRRYSSACSVVAPSSWSMKAVLFPTAWSSVSAT